ncbi:MAG: 23S rRNA (guanosine(2251)-2'-O)-methyltransferase RlmB [Nostocoides sp.]
MAGNSRRRGAVRSSNKKGATVGSGGQRRKALEGKGPTPKATDRPGHKAYRGGGTGHGAARPGAGKSGSRRDKPTSELVAGRNAVLEALRTDIPATTLYLASRLESDERVKEILKHAAERGLPVLETTRTELDRLSDGAVHQGVALSMPPYAYAHPGELVDPQTRGVPTLVALDGITDPRNLGAIIRSVAAFGGHGVLIPARRSAGMTAAAWKSSAGAAARIPVAQAANLTRALADLRKQGFFVIGLDMDGEVELPELALTDVPLVIVVGSEGKGLSRLVRETCDQLVSVPMSSAVESLNAGIAAGVALYEVARQRR